MSRYRRMRQGRVTQVQGIASRGEDFFLMEVKYYINDFEDLAVELVKVRRHTRYGRMVLFLERWQVKIARKVYEEVKLDKKKLKTFEGSGVFNEVVEGALNHNHADADFHH